MNPLLKSLLIILATVILYAGPILAVLIAVTGAWLRMQNVGAPPLQISLAGAFILAFQSLLVGGGLKLLISIDDRLERLERKA